MDNNTHNINLLNRKKLILDGVAEVISFDDLSVVLETFGGKMTVNGDGLHIQKLCLESGDVEIEGRIDEIIYENTEKTGKGFFGRLIR